MRRIIPEASTICKGNVEPAYETTLRKIREEIGDGDPIWISLDETTDKNGRFVSKFVIIY